MTAAPDDARAREIVRKWCDGWHGITLFKDEVSSLEAAIATAIREARDEGAREIVLACEKVAVDRAGQFHENWKADINDNYVAGKRDGADIVADLIRALPMPSEAPK